MHVPVLLKEVINGLKPRKGETVLDATLGLGGHARALCELIGPSGFLIGMDADENILSKTKGDIEKTAIYRYSLPVFLSLFFFTTLYTADTILVKHFFEDAQAGNYLAAALAGKIVFFASMAVTLVMFPKVTESHTLKKPSKIILLKALTFILLISLLTTLVYALFPELIINILFGEQFQTIQNLLIPFSLAMGLFSLSYALSFYNLSLNKSNFIFLPALLLVLEGVLIVLKHNTLREVVMILVAIMAVLFISLGIYTWNAIKKLDY